MAQIKKEHKPVATKKRGSAEPFDLTASPWLNFSPATLVGDSADRVHVRVAHTFTDRLFGSVEYLSVFGDVTNMLFVARQIANPAVREEVSRFFRSRAIGQMFRGLVGSTTFRGGGLYFTKAELLRALREHQGHSVDAANVIMEIVAPVLIKQAVMSSDGKFSVREEYPRALVTVEALTADVVIQGIESAIRSAMTGPFVILPGRTYSSSAAAEALGEHFYSLGAQLVSMDEQVVVINDLVKAIRFNIDPYPERSNLTGTVPASLANHEAVKYFSENLTFINAALSLRDQELTPAAAGWQHDSWLGPVFASIRSSQRYSVVSKAEYCSRFSVTAISDLRDVPVACVVVESAKMEGVALGVVPADDSIAPGAQTFVEPREKVGAKIAASLKSVSAALTTDSVGELVSTLLRNEVQMDSVTDPVGRHRNGACIISMERDPAVVMSRVAELAAMVSDHLEFHVDDESSEVLYRVTPRELHYQPISGNRGPDFAIVADAGEAIFMSGERKATTTLATRPQLISEAAMRSRVFGVPDSIKLPINRRASYNLDVYGLQLRGSLKLSDFEMMYGSDYVTLIKPFFDASVVESIRDTFAWAYNDIALKSEDTLGFVQIRECARWVLNIARAVSPSFRSEVHRTIIDRATLSLKKGDAELLRARLRQQAYSVVVDLYALDLVLRRNGLIEEEAAVAEDGGESATTKQSLIGGLINDPSFQLVLRNFDSDRY